MDVDDVHSADVVFPGDLPEKRADVDDEELPLEINSSTEPTLDRRALAHQLLAVHVPVHVPEQVCHQCLKPYPCSHVRWARVVLQRAGENSHG